MSAFGAMVDTVFLINKKSEGFLALRLDFLSYNNYNVSVWRWRCNEDWKTKDGKCETEDNYDSLI